MTEKEIDQIFSAKPIDAPDRAKVKWPKRKKFRPLRGRTELKPRQGFHPGTKEARQLLDQAGRNLRVCDQCGSTFRVSVHHRDRNPFNNSLDNLTILCSDCHSRQHNVEP